MNISHWKPLLGGTFAFLLVLHGTVVKADDNKSKDSSKAKRRRSTIDSLRTRRPRQHVVSSSLSTSKTTKSTLNYHEHCLRSR